MIFDWNDHYKAGGRSGPSDYYEVSVIWKNILSLYCDLNKDTFIDIGCGDLEIWNNKLPSHYTGVDISTEIVLKNKKKYPELTFIDSNAAIDLNISADIVVCLNVLYHVMDDDDYIKILNNIKKYSNHYIFIVTWNKNIFDRGILFKLWEQVVNIKKGRPINFRITDGDGIYQKYRDFLKISIPIFFPEFKLINQIIDKDYPDGSVYVFEKIWVITINIT